MRKDNHPLLSNPNWIHIQPSIGFTSYYTSIDRSTGEQKVNQTTTASTCREGIISGARVNFQNTLTNILERNSVASSKGPQGWKKAPPLELIRNVDLTTPRVSKKHATVLEMQWGGYLLDKFPGQDQFPIESFLRVCDIVLGPLCVLFGPDRPKGDKWWVTSEESAQTRKRSALYIQWRGSSNWFLNHPALLSIATGIFRQCFQLCGAGLAEEISESVNERDIKEVMSTGSQRLALEIIKQTRQYIEVPVAKGGYFRNLPFVVGYWRRLMRLQRAIRRHGYEGAIGQTFAEGWFLVGRGYDCRGTWSLWGSKEDTDELTSAHRHLMTAGAPRRKQDGAPKKPGSKRIKCR